MTSQSIVRRAEPQDRDELWRLFRLLHSENAMCRISERKVDYHLNRFLNPSSIPCDDAGPRGFIGVIGTHDALEAAIMLVLTQQWYSEDFMLEEFFAFVHPDHRSSNHAKSLLDFSKHLVDENIHAYPTLRLVIGILSFERTAAKIRLYAQKLKFCGAFFTYPPVCETSSDPLGMLKIRLHKNGATPTPKEIQ